MSDTHPRPMSEAPETGEWITVRTVEVNSYRYKLYKPSGAQQMKARGRWQRATEYGGWENCKKPEGVWLPEGWRFTGEDPAPGVAASETGDRRMSERSALITVRIPAALKARLEQPRIGPYSVSISRIVKRGIELALAELDQMAEDQAKWRGRDRQESPEEAADAASERIIAAVAESRAK